MTSFNVYVHCSINCFYLAPKNKLRFYFTYTMHFKKCPALFSHMCMELLFNPLMASRTNIVTRGVLAAYNQSTATKPEETTSN